VTWAEAITTSKLNGVTRSGNHTEIEIFLFLCKELKKKHVLIELETRFFFTKLRGCLVPDQCWPLLNGVAITVVSIKYATFVTVSP